MNQEELVSIYNTLKPLLQIYQKKGLIAKIDLDSRFDLWSVKSDIVAFGKPRKEVAFAGLIIQSSYVGFYFMPIYSDPEQSGIFGKELLATLKGKSCFHIKKLTPLLVGQVKDALAKGYKIYKEKGWC